MKQMRNEQDRRAACHCSPHTTKWTGNVDEMVRGPGDENETRGDGGTAQRAERSAHAGRNASRVHGQKARRLEESARKGRRAPQAAAQVTRISPREYPPRGRPTLADHLNQSPLNSSVNPLSPLASSLLHTRHPPPSQAPSPPPPALLFRLAQLRTEAPARRREPYLTE